LGPGGTLQGVAVYQLLGGERAPGTGTDVPLTVNCYAGAVKCFKYVEWDEATVPGIFMSGYQFGEGRLTLEGTPGFGVELDEELFGRAVASTGFDLRIERT
jgi:hypothetical protein